MTYRSHRAADYTIDELMCVSSARQLEIVGGQARKNLIRMVVEQEGTLA